MFGLEGGETREGKRGKRHFDIVVCGAREGKRFMLFMFSDAMAKDQADAIEAKSKIVSVREKIKLVDDSFVWLFYVGFHFSLCLFSPPPSTPFSSSLQAFPYEIFCIITSTTHII